MGSEKKLTVSTGEIPATGNKKLAEISPFPTTSSEDITEQDEIRFFEVISVDLSEAQQARLKSPKKSFPRQANVLAVHWHPEFIPIDLIRTRIENTFPDMKDAVIIPTQHNEITSYDGVYSGVEIDCYSSGFNQKVQLLLHMRKEIGEQADVLQSMAAYTYRYRSSQLFEFMHSFVKPVESRIHSAMQTTGADENTVRFTIQIVKKIHRMVEKHHDRIPPIMFKNKLLGNYMDLLRDEAGDVLIDRAQSFLKAVKACVKAEFPMTYFYRTSEVIEEARAVGAGIVIPHPEQFWPILLADYDVDGIEIWNPQSQRYTDFLISVINRKNSARARGSRRLLLFMGDDTHMGEKAKDPEVQNPVKAAREIGVQPGWEDLTIKKQLILAGMTVEDIMHEYRSRLGTA